MFNTVVIKMGQKLTQVMTLKLNHTKSYPHK